MTLKTAWVIHHSEPTPSYNSSTMLEAFRKNNIEPQLINFDELSLANTDILYNNEPVSPPSFAVFVNQTHTVLNSPIYEQRNNILEKIQSFQNTIFANQPLAHAAAANKNYVYQVLNSAGIPYPRTEFVDTDPDSPALPLMIERIGEFPIVVKYPFGFEGMAVKICYDAEELKSTIQELKASARVSIGSVILQEYISAAEAAMLCVRVVGDQVFTRMFLGSPYEESTFKSIVALGRQQLPCVTTAVVRQAAVAVTEALNLNCARIDMFLSNDGSVKVCDVNSIGSFLPTDQTHNVRVAELIADMVIDKQQEQ